MTPGTAEGSRLRNALATVGATATRLSQVSQRSFQNPYTAVEWPQSVEPERDWFSTPEHLSLYGTAVWDRLDEPTRKRLAFFEAANFYSLNIHGEKSLMQGLAARLYRPDLMDVANYLHHFLDEENKHSIFFGTFCTRYARVFPTRQLPMGAARPPRDIEDFLFFAKTFIFEEIVDRYNWIQSRDERLHQLARFINHNHHVEEARHLIFGRELVAAMWAACSPGWTSAQVTDVRDHLDQFMTASWREYYNPDVYTEVGLVDPWEIAELAWADDEQRARRRSISVKPLRFLRSIGVFPEDPTDAF